jgi:hypothetical protein
MNRLKLQFCSKLSKKEVSLRVRNEARKEGQKILPIKFA